MCEETLTSYRLMLHDIPMWYPKSLFPVTHPASCYSRISLMGTSPEPDRKSKSLGAARITIHGETVGVLALDMEQ